MRVLVAVEDDVFGEAIVDFVSAHAWEPDTEVSILHVVEPTLVADEMTALYGSGMLNQILEERVKHGTELVNRLKSKLSSKLGELIPVKANVMIGNPEYAIVEAAGKWCADLLVLGSHGRTGMSRFFLGSVSLAVVANAKCSISIIRLPKKSPVKDSKVDSREKAVT